jgi:signal-transduction protein with cAMP-binding, CBS, and nucleotidyltransferase domain
MQIHNFLKERKRKKILLSINSETSLKQVFLEINRKKTGFIILKKKNKYEIVTDGDLRRCICKKDINLQDKILNKVIGTSKITFIDYKKSLYNAARIFFKK